MNKRIKELAKQSFQKCMDENGFLNNTSWRINPDHYAESEVFEKFAELIVLEMCGMMEQAQNDCDTGDATETNRGYISQLQDWIDRFKQHFGVEELLS